MRELVAYEMESQALAAFLSGLGEPDWIRPTRCLPMRVREVVAHLLGQAEGVATVCGNGPVEGPAEKDRLTWWRYDRDEDAAETLSATNEFAATLPAGPLGALFDRGVRRAVAAAAKLAVIDPVVQTSAGRIRLSDYLATRVLEATIHAWDLCDAVGLGPAPTHEGLGVTGDVMRGLLGADVRALGIGDVDLALAGSGRRALGDSERRALGPLADRFPLLT